MREVSGETTSAQTHSLHSRLAQSLACSSFTKLTVRIGGTRAKNVRCQTMSQDGQGSRVAAGRVLDVVVFVMEAGACFDAHVHADHQLAWASEGVLTVECAKETWVLPPTRALWIPAGVRHETKSSGPAIMRTAYINPDRSPFNFSRPTPIGADRLLAELISYLADAPLDPAATTRGRNGPARRHLSPADLGDRVADADR